MVQVRQTFSVIYAWPRVRLGLFFFHIAGRSVGVVGLLELDLASIPVHLEVSGGQQARQFGREQALFYFKCHYKYFINEQIVPPSSPLLLRL